jgi:plastocyanin
MAFAGVKVGVAVMVLLAMTAAMAMASPVEYVVHWDFPTSNQYYGDTQTRTYKVGDQLKFLYAPEMHNVVKVASESDLTHCTTHTKIGPEQTDGQTSVTLNKPGAHYFICSVPGHCEDGMKIKILVHA